VTLKRIILLLVLAVVLVASCGDKEKVEKGPPAPGFELKNLEGESVKLSDFKGKVVLLNFWATWCPPCIKEMPMFQDLYQKHKDKGFVILGVSMDKSKKIAQKFIQKEGITYPILMGNPELGAKYRVRGLPTSYIIGRQGHLLRQFMGMPSKRKLEKVLLELFDR
jgi:peroxiredoxin